MKKVLIFTLVLICVGAVLYWGYQTWYVDGKNVSSEHGLYVGKEGVLMKDQEVYHGIGVNYFNAFLRVIENPEDDSYRDGFAVLSEYNIPFIRFNAGGYWPVEWELYKNDKDLYFQLFDEFVAAAEEFGIGLIPSLFWHHATVPDIVGEPRNQWGNKESQTHAFMRTYTQEIVTRYVDSPAIWGWEFGNEYNLEVDLPNASDHRPPIQPDLGTPSSRSEDDDLTSDMVRTAFNAFAEEVRKYDTSRLITTGNSILRPSAWNQMSHGTWDQDNESEFREMLIADHPEPMDVVSVHLYYDTEEPEETRFSRTLSINELLSELMQISEEMRKPLFVGEAGAGEENGNESGRQQFEQMITAIEENNVPLTAVWVFDYSAQEEWNVTDTNARAYQLERIQLANQQMQNMNHQ